LEETWDRNLSNSSVNGSISQTSHRQRLNGIGDA
jgi:hypothetical protein